jgi:hypothetical protein
LMQPIERIFIAVAVVGMVGFVTTIVYLTR